jgi:DNA polymerase III epsilon subunit-like protein
MQCDHVFVDLAVTDPNPTTGKIVGIAVVRTDRKGKVLESFSQEVDSETDIPVPEGETLAVVVSNMKKCILDSRRYDSSYVVIGTHTETDRAHLRNFTKDKSEVFAGRGWIDILALSFPLCYYSMIPDRSFDSLCKHFEVTNTAPNTAMGDCEALVRVYWALMTRYKTALGGEEILREIGGTPLKSLRKIVGL